MNAKTFGEWVKELRIKKDLTLRDCSQQLGVDPSNWSKIERGVNPAPKSDDTVAEWAKFLGLSGDDIVTFKDAAALSRNQLPKDLASDERVLEALPVFFRVARGATMDEKALDQFVETVRQLHTRDA